MSESNQVGISEAPASSNSLADRQVAATQESERLAEALGKLESAAPPDAYWYMDDRKGLFDRLVDWQARRKAAAEIDGGFADSAPPLANRMGVLIAGMAVAFVTLGAIYGMRAHFNKEFSSASANSLTSNVPSPELPQPALERQPPGVSLKIDPESESLLANSPTVSVTEFDDPFLGLAAQEPAKLSHGTFNPATPGGVPGPVAPPGQIAQSSEDSGASSEGNAVAPSGEVVLIYAPPAREQRMPERRSARLRDDETDRARTVQTQIQTRAIETSVRSPRKARARASASRERDSAMDRDDERRIDKQADRAFQAEYRREFDRDRRNRNDWRPSPTSAVDPKNPNWGWD